MKKIENDPDLGEDTLKDNNRIEFLLFISYGFQTFKLFIIIVNISFFVGMFWLIYCDVTMQIGINNPLFKTNEWFMTKFEIVDQSKFN